MTPYAPSEAAIEAAIKRQIGNAGFFQRVAEQLARGLYVDLAAGLVPVGRRPDDKTVSGWPDAYLTKAGGTLIAIEATTESKAKTRHWRADLAKLEAKFAPGLRGGLIWVAWSDAARPTDAAGMRDQACRHGLPSEDVHILFRKDVCSRLRAPYHARFWINDLGLKGTSEPFSRVEDVIGRTNMRRSVGVFPTVEEYEEYRVYAPPVLAEVERTLAERHGAMIVGHGAAGKTTLAMVLSFRPRYRHAPTYYLDLTSTATDLTVAERVGEAIAAVADRGVLFIIDNAHLAPEVAARVFGHWEHFGRESDLLILTRRIRSQAEAWNDEPESEMIPLPRFDLVIQPADLEGVYRRHHRARTDHEAPPVVPDLLDQWHRLFGGDLMSFSAAVLGLLDRGGEVATLGPADARAYIRKNYLSAPQLTTEQPALLDLAAVAEVEGIVPVEAFAAGALVNCIRLGLVWVETLGSNNQYEYYRLAHPGLGTLLRDAADRTATSRDDRCRVLGVHPVGCVALAAALHKAGEDAEAEALIATLWRTTEWPLGHIPLSRWRRASEMTLDLKVLGAEAISTRRRSWLSHSAGGDELVKRALATQLHFLASFLTYARTAMPETVTVIRDGLAKNPDELVKRALATPLDHLASFLTYARTAMPAIAKAVSAELVAAKNRILLVDLYTNDGPEKITAICKFEEAFAGILSAIDAESWSRRWSKSTLGQPQWFRSFATYCYRAGRADLVGVVANAIVREGQADDFPSPGITILHLNFILASPHDCTPAEVEDFFARCFAPNWLATQYRSRDATVGALAGAVRSIAMDEREWIRPHFRDPALLERVHAERPTASHSPTHVSSWLQLFCATRLLDRRMTHPRLTGPLSLAEVLKVAPPGQPDRGIQSMQAGLWAGLREWCHTYRERPVVDAALAEGILAQFRAADLVGRPRLTALNVIMIDWLERCQAQQWRLVVEQDSLLDALERQLHGKSTSEFAAAT